jgi:hypothetical protein
MQHPASKWFRRSLAVAGLSTVAALPFAAQALPKVGGTAPAAAKVVDVDERSLSLETLRGQPVLVVYEDKDSSKLNAALKRELDELMKSQPRLRKVRVVAVADVSEYDFWPAKGAVKDAIRDEQKKANTTIYLDWSADFRSKLALDRATSNVVLFDGEGRFVFARSGALAPADRKALVEAMQSLAGGS